MHFRFYDIFVNILDINECDNNAHGCSNGATCVNTAGSYTCTCLPGWTSGMCQIGKYFV